MPALNRNQASMTGLNTPLTRCVPSDWNAKRTMSMPAWSAWGSWWVGEGHAGGCSCSCGGCIPTHGPGLRAVPLHHHRHLDRTHRWRCPQLSPWRCPSGTGCPQWPTPGGHSEGREGRQGRATRPGRVGRGWGGATSVTGTQGRRRRGGAEGAQRAQQGPSRPSRRSRGAAGAHHRDSGGQHAVAEDHGGRQQHDDEEGRLRRRAALKQACSRSRVGRCGGR